jgi:hypothetical protein
MTTAELSPDECALVVQLLAPRMRCLSDLLAVQVADLPPGCDDWGDTADQLAIARGLLHKVTR